MGFYLVFGNIIEPTLAKTLVLDNFSLWVNGQMLKNNLATRSHWWWRSGQWNGLTTERYRVWILQGSSIFNIEEPVIEVTICQGSKFDWFSRKYRRTFAKWKDSLYYLIVDKDLQ